MKQKLREIQQSLVRQIWEDYNDILTAQQVAEIFGIGVKKFYRLVRKVAEEDNKDNKK